MKRTSLVALALFFSVRIFAEVSGPSTSTIGNVSLWDDATGTLLADSKLYSDSNGNLSLGVAPPVTAPSAGGQLLNGRATVITSNVGAAFGYGYYLNSSSVPKLMVNDEAASKMECNGSGYCAAFNGDNTGTAGTTALFRKSFDTAGGVGILAYNGFRMKAVAKAAHGSETIESVGSTETTIASVNLGDHFGWGQAVDDNAHYFEVSGTFASNSNNKRIRCYSGAALAQELFFDSGTITPSGGSWSLRSNIYWRGESDAKATTTMVGDTMSNIVQIATYAPLHAATGYLIRCTATGVTNGDITGETFHLFHTF